VIFVYGSGYYGKVDQVPGVCYVITLFGHFCFVPLFPQRTYLVREGTETYDATFGLALMRFSGVRLRLSLKSVLFGWLRVLLLMVEAHCPCSPFWCR
jgi:hypothetical protein